MGKYHSDMVALRDAIVSRCIIKFLSLLLSVISFGASCRYLFFYWIVFKHFFNIVVRVPLNITLSLEAFYLV